MWLSRRDMPDFVRSPDAFVWSIERDPRLRSTIVTLVLLDRSPEWNDVVGRFETLTQAIPRFRQKMTPSLYPLPPQWREDHDFDLSFHVRRVAAPSPGTLDCVLEMARIDAMADFDRARPLWEATLVEGIAGGGAALLLKIHHALTDGVGAVQMASILFDRRGAGRRPAGRPPSQPIPDEGMAALLGRVAVFGVRTLTGSVKLVVDSIRQPVGAAAEALSTVASVYRTVRPITRPGSPIMFGRSGVRRLAVTQVSTEKLHRAASEAGGSLNDAFIAAVATGISKYHGKRGAAVDNFVVCMPISVRGVGDPIGGNRATLMRFDVPATDIDAAQRIRLIHEQTTRARGEKSLAHTELIAGALNVMPLDYVSSTLRHVDFVASDVPGFAEPLDFAGAAVTMPYAFSPTIGAAVNVTLLTYVDRCAVGINVDAGAIPDLGVLYDCLASGFDDVLALAGPR